jgi:NitT/TauT family transport system permease protein
VPINAAQEAVELLKHGTVAKRAEDATSLAVLIAYELGAADARQAGLVQGLRATLAVLAAPAVGLLALLAHKYIPNKQSAPPTKLYPLMLEIGISVTLFFAAVQWAWRPVRPWVRAKAPLWAGGLFLLALWDTITLKLALLPMPYFPGPDMVFQGLLDEHKVLLDSTYHSLTLLLSGYLTGVVAGVCSGVLMGWFLNVRYWGMPLMKMVGPIPATALVPTAMVLFSNAYLSGTALIAWGVWFPVTMLTTSGIANVPVSLLEVARTLGAGRLYLIFRVAIPAAMPSIFVGLFMGLLVSFLALIVAETVGVKNGLGFYVKWQQSYAEYAKVYGAIVIMAIFFTSLLTLLFKARDWVLVWQRGVIMWYLVGRVGRVVRPTAAFLAGAAGYRTLVGRTTHPTQLHNTTLRFIRDSSHEVPE